MKRTARIAAFSAFLVLGLQTLLWATVGRAQVFEHAIDWYFEAWQHHSNDSGYAVDGLVPPGSIVLASEFAERLGEARFHTLVRRAARCNQEVRVAANWDGDRLAYNESFNTPLVARAEVGFLAPGCSLMGKVDFVYVLGFWIRVPD